MTARSPNPTYQGKTVVVTGATGLVGAHLCRRLLAEGAEVVAVIRDPDPHSALYRAGDAGRVRVVMGALEDPRTLERALTHFRPNALFHLGAQTQVQVARGNPVETFESNIRGTWLTLEAARIHGKALEAVVIASSDKAYGESDVLPYVEDTPLRGTFPYDASKACTDIIARSYAVTYDMPVTIARCGNIFGGGDLNWDRLIPGCARWLIQNERPVLRSNGGPLRDWIYVADVVDAYVTLAHASSRPEVRGEAFNFANAEPKDVLTVLAAIQQAVGTKLEPIIQSHAPGEIAAQHLSFEKAARMLAWSPKTSFDEAMHETVAWYRAYLKDIA